MENSASIFIGLNSWPGKEYEIPALKIFKCSSDVLMNVSLLFPLKLMEIGQEKFSSICFSALEDHTLYQAKTQSSLLCLVHQIVFIYNRDYNKKPLGPPLDVEHKGEINMYCFNPLRAQNFCYLA